MSETPHSFGHAHREDVGSNAIVPSTSGTAKYV